MANVSIDSVQLLSAEEERGIVRKMTRKALVQFQPADSIPQDFTVLAKALNQAGIPLPLSAYVPGAPVPAGPPILAVPFHNLVLIGRGVEIIEQDPGWVGVTLKYEHILDGPNQQLIGAGARGVIYAKGRSSVVQKPTNFYPAPTIPISTTLTGVDPSGLKGTFSLNLFNAAVQPGVQISVSWTLPGPPPFTVSAKGYIQSVINGVVAFVLNPGSTPLPANGTAIMVSPTVLGSLQAGRQQIVVAHTYPWYDPDVAGLTIVPGFPNTVFQVGEVQLPYPQSDLQIQGLINTSNPWSVEARFIRTVNAKEWLGKPTGTWLCSEIKWECLDTGQNYTPVYSFSFEFQNDVDGWNPYAVFHDQRTGRPPAGILPATVADANGVLNQAINPFSQRIQPAGYWQVPQLQPVDYDALFAAFFEGGNPPEVD